MISQNNKHIRNFLVLSTMVVAIFAAGIAASYSPRLEVSDFSLKEVDLSHEVGDQDFVVDSVNIHNDGNIDPVEIDDSDYFPHDGSNDSWPCICPPGPTINE